MHTAHFLSFTVCLFKDIRRKNATLTSCHVQGTWKCHEHWENTWVGRASLTNASPGPSGRMRPDVCLVCTERCSGNLSIQPSSYFINFSLQVTPFPQYFPIFLPQRAVGSEVGCIGGCSSAAGSEPPAAPVVSVSSWAQWRCMKPGRMEIIVNSASVTVSLQSVCVLLACLILGALKIALL